MINMVHAPLLMLFSRMFSVQIVTFYQYNKRIQDNVVFEMMFYTAMFAKPPYIIFPWIYRFHNEIDLSKHNDVFYTYSNNNVYSQCKRKEVCKRNEC